MKEVPNLLLCKCSPIRFIGNKKNSRVRVDPTLTRIARAEALGLRQGAPSIHLRRGDMSIGFHELVLLLQRKIFCVDHPSLIKRPGKTHKPFPLHEDTDKVG